MRISTSRGIPELLREVIGRARTDSFGMGFCFMGEGQHGVGCESERVPVFGWRKIMRGGSN